MAPLVFHIYSCAAEHNHAKALQLNIYVLYTYEQCNGSSAHRKGLLNVYVYIYENICKAYNDEYVLHVSYNNGKANKF